jgi:hypothetical protein
MKYKVNDKVRLINKHTDNPLEVGKIYEIDRIDSSNGDYPYLPKESTCFVKEEWLEPVQEPIASLTNLRMGEERDKEMQRFKVGDKVLGVSRNDFHDCEGIITEILGEKQRIKLTKLSAACDYWNVGDETPTAMWDQNNGLRLISSANKTMAYTLTASQEKHLDDDSKALIKIGVLNSDLTVGSSSKVIMMLVELNRKALADAAREELAAEAKQEEEDEGDE